MKNIQNFEEFCNEEINLKSALTGAALAGSLLMSSPQKALANQGTKMELQELKSDETLFTRQITVSGPQQEVFRKVVLKLRENGGRVTMYSNNNLSAQFTFQDVKPDNSNGFTNVEVEVEIEGNNVTLKFKKADFFYSGTQPESIGDRNLRNLKSAGIDQMTNLARGLSPHPIIGNLIGQEIQKNKRNLYKAESNFKYQDAVSSSKDNHKSFIKNINIKADQLANLLK